MINALNMKNMLFQHDGTTCYTAREIKDSLKKTIIFRNFIQDFVMFH